MVVGLVHSGGLEEDQVFTKLGAAQPGSRVFLTELIACGSPVNSGEYGASRVRGKDPKQTTPEECVACQYALWQRGGRLTASLP